MRLVFKILIFSLILNQIKNIQFLNNNRSTLLNLGNNLAQVVSFEKSAKKIKFLKEILSREITDAAYVKEYCKINEIRNIYGCRLVGKQ